MSRFEETGSPFAPAPVVELALGQVMLSKARRKEFNLKDQQTAAFLDSVRRLGILDAVDVRQVEPGRYELVFGRRRLWAASVLGFGKVPARIGDWSDRQVEWVVAAETKLAGPMSPVQFAKALLGTIKGVDDAFGPGAGREASVVSRLTGSTPGIAADDILVASAFTPDQLEAMEMFHVSKADLLKMAKLEKQPRAEAVNLMATGMTIEEALADIGVNADSPQAGSRRVRETDLSDDEWLVIQCPAVRDQLQDSTIFDRAALLYRRTRNDRGTLRTKIKDRVAEARQLGGDPFSALLTNLIYIEHPCRWTICQSCSGRNADTPECPGCAGAGFGITHESVK
ncbi:MAG: ParB/RepB/Spo0J family partition protein [Isosphaeraceae bacterium]